LDPLPNIQVVAEAADAPAAMSQLFRCPIDLVLLDIGLPGRSGVELLKQIKASWPKLPVLILSNYPEDQYAVRVLKQGAAGYLTKETAPERLAEAIRRVAQGGRFITETVAERLIDSVAGDSERAPHESLSDREFEVFKQIAAGRSLTEIADTHNVSVKTVSTQRARILEKTGLATNADITRYALAHRLVE
jgi:DNA-binding NarL/FixJ family response regulator